jgi:hypothetical protein
MAILVQGWRKKWFYIQDQKAASSNQFRIALFDAKAKLTKLTSWDSPPTKAKVKSIKPLLTRIQALKSAAGGGLTGMQLMVFFLQRRIQTLQARVSKLWSYSSSDDPSRVSNQDPEKKDLDKRVRSLTTLTKEKEIPALTVDFLDSTHPLPKVRVSYNSKILTSALLRFFDLHVISSRLYFLSSRPSSFGFSPSSSRGRTTPG